ncbi:hypothetical protein KUTeg_012941 [Tegillarca granosa]|uniref:SPARC-related modular calcium-binding protein 1 n=1 Tax=Tegillarca granosa TaxID=220873 RepID=A0ABQ9EWU0_TEGGR|nr:hypothetical protein KUTeg_012941 [Tegillarca granosa]
MRKCIKNFHNFSDSATVSIMFGFPWGMTIWILFIIVFVYHQSSATSDSSDLSVSQIQATGKVLFRALRNSECKIDCSNKKRRLVCGSDGVTYHSRCHVKKAKRCEGRRVKVKRKGKCSGSTECMRERENAQAVARKPTVGVFVPECKKDGSYAEIQCHAATGYCWCTSKDGKPVPGTSKRGTRPICKGKPRRRKNKSKGKRKRKREEYNRMMATSGASRNSVTSEGGKNDPMLTPLEQRVMLWKFSELDKNGDNKLRRREVRNLKRVVKKLIKPRACAKNFVKYCDLDQNKRIERDEWTLCLGKDISKDSLLKLIDIGPRPPTLWSSPRLDPKSSESRPPVNDGSEDRIKSCREEREAALRQQQDDPNGCPLTTKRQFLLDMVEVFIQQMTSNSTNQSNLPTQSETITKEEKANNAIRWKFNLLDKNGNSILERKELKHFRKNIPKKKDTRKCSRNFIRYCDENVDRKVTLEEWLECTNNALYLPTRRGRNPFSDILNPRSTECMRERENAQAVARKPTVGVFVPECKKDGSYAEIQCHAATGYCWCTSKDGKPVPGTSKRGTRPICKGKPRRRKNKSKGKRKRKRGVTSEGGKNDPMLTPLEQRVMLWKFSELDKNGDNKLRRREVRNLKRVVKKLIKPRACAKNFVKYCDLDQNKRIERDEWTLCLEDSLLKLIDIGPRPPTLWSSPRLDPKSSESRPPVNDGSEDRIKSCREEREAALRQQQDDPNGCPLTTKRQFLLDMVEVFIQQMTSNSTNQSNLPTQSETITKEEKANNAIRWKFNLLDKNGNSILERKELKHFRKNIPKKKDTRKCSRNFIRYCDENVDRKVTLEEWLECTNNALYLPTRRGRNPFSDILNPILLLLKIFKCIPSKVRKKKKTASFYKMFSLTKYFFLFHTHGILNQFLFLSDKQLIRFFGDPASLTNLFKSVPVNLFKHLQKCNTDEQCNNFYNTVVKKKEYFNLKNTIYKSCTDKS